MENYDIKMWLWEDGDGSDSVRWAARRKTRSINSVCFEHWMSVDGMVEYELSVKVVEYYLEE